MSVATARPIIQDLAPSASRPGQGGTAPSSQSFDLGQAPVQSESNCARGLDNCELGWLQVRMIGPNRQEGSAMFRYVLPVLAALVLITASLIPDDAFARGRGGGGYRGGGGFHGGAARVGGVRGGAIHAGRVGRVPCADRRVTAGEGIIHVADTVRRRWAPQRLVPRPTVPTAPTALQQLLRHVRQLYLRQSVSILTRAGRMPTAVGPVLTAVPFS